MRTDYLRNALLLLIACGAFEAHLSNRTLSAAQTAFDLGGETVLLNEITSEVKLQYQGMRFNRAANAWNVEVTVLHEGERDLDLPCLLLIESFSGTSGPLLTDGVTETAPPRFFYDLGPALPGGLLKPGERSQPRTLVLGYLPDGAPSLTVRVFAGAPLSNAPPVLTQLQIPTNATEEASFAMDYDMLLQASDARDPDGDPIFFRVEAVLEGELTKNAIAVIPGVTLLGPGEQWVWFPAPGMAGQAIPAFSLAAFDGLAVSTPPVEARINVNPAPTQNRPPTLTQAGTIPGAQLNLPFPVPYSTLLAASDAADPDGDTVFFRLAALHAGTLTRNGVPAVEGVTLLGPGEQWIWTPPAGEHGEALQAFSVVAFDGELASIEPVPVTILVGESETFSLALTRTLNEMGQPLPGAEMIEFGPVEEISRRSDPELGLVTMGQGSGAHVWKFSAPGHLPVWRKATIDPGEVAVIPNPRLSRRAILGTASPLSGGKLTGNGIEVQVPPGAVAQTSDVYLTPLTGQSLPAFLPLGWSPLQAFWMEIGTSFLIPANVVLQPWEALRAEDTPVVVRWNEATLQWEAAVLPAFSPGEAVQFQASAPGAYALVAPDGGENGPPLPQVGQSLPGSGLAVPPLPGLSAVGSVTPSASPASLVPELVTGWAEVVLSSAGDPLPSGMVLHCEVLERYQLRGGSKKVLPRYDHFVVGYQRPGDRDPATLHARFPMRPLLLFPADELEEATIRAEVFAPEPFGGGVLGGGGGLAAHDGIQIAVEPGDLESPQAVRIRRLDGAEFEELAGENMIVARAFELASGSVAEGRKLNAAFGLLDPSSFYVLGMVLSREGMYGLEPRERFLSDASGLPASIEPPAGERLPGIMGPGLYLLLKVETAQALVSGTVRDEADNPAAGMPVRIAGQPWLTFSGREGRYRLLAPKGEAEIEVTDTSSGDTTMAQVLVGDPFETFSVELGSQRSGPRVVSITPSDGSQNISRVTSVVIAFNKPVDPASAGLGAIQLLGPEATPVPAIVNFDLRNTVATLLPVERLEPNTLFQARLASGLSDAQGLPLEGAREFMFQTAPEPARDQAAQLIVYEPGAKQVPEEVLNQIPAYDPELHTGMVVVHGTQGAADPEAPVILINESTGETATVLSKLDGSFYGFIRGEEDDFISATILNQNGSQVYLPLSKQLFDNGFVGLFQQGGLLEAESDGGPVQVLVEPGSIPSKTKFKLDFLPMNELFQLVKNAEPAGGKLLGGFKLTAEGDDLKSSAKVRAPIDPTELGLPPNQDPEESGFGLAIVREVDGQVVYDLIDKMRYVDGHLETASYPFLGLATAGLGAASIHAYLKIANGRQAVVSGNVYFASFLDSGAPDVTTKRPVPGAVVFAVPSGLGLIGNGELFPGAIVATADENGFFAYLVPADNLDSSGTAYSLMAVSPLFPGVYGIGSAAVSHDQDVASAQGEVWFNLSSSRTGLRGPDHVPPVLSVIHAPALPGLHTSVVLRALATDNREVDWINMEVVAIEEIRPGQVPSSADLVIEGMSASSSSTGETLRQEWQLHALSPMKATFRFVARDASANASQLLYTIEFGGDGAVLVNPDPDPEDTTGPFVVRSSPSIGEEAVLPGTPIRLTFNEPIDPGFKQNLSLAVQMTPNQGRPTVFLSEDRRELTLHYYQLEPDTSYSLLVTPVIQDDNGNGLDQNPYTPETADNFLLTFKTAPVELAPLPGVVQGGGLAALGDHLFVLDRGNGQEGSVAIFSITDPANPQLVNRHRLTFKYPRDILAIPQYAYKRKLTGLAETNDLLVVVGGNVGEGQRIAVLNVSNPAQPVSLAGSFVTRSPSSAVVKLDWSPPLLGYLEMDADITSVGLINLQLFIYAQNLTPEERGGEPPGGFEGLDLNGDGDYVDSGEAIPRIDGSRPTADLVNGGLVDAHTLRLESTQRLRDFSLEFGGSFLAVALSAGQDLDLFGAPVADAPPMFFTMVSGNQRLVRAEAAFELPRDPRRVFTLFNVRLETGLESRLANLAMVSLGGSSSEPSSLLVIDITEPKAPRQIAEITIPPEHGTAQSVRARDDGLLMLAASQDLLLLDPSKLEMPPQAGNPIHPALVGLIGGMGTGTRAFAGSSDPMSGIAYGGRNLVQALPGKIDLVLHRPGTMDRPGPIVPQAAEMDPHGVLVFVNSDKDGAMEVDSPDPEDRDLPFRSALDNDLIRITLKRIPPLISGVEPRRVVFDVKFPGSANPAVGLLNPFGFPLTPTSATASGFTVESSSMIEGSLLERIKREDVSYLLEGLEPYEGVTVSWRVFGPAGQLLGEDQARFSVISVEIKAIWSEQFPNSRSNYLPGNVGDRNNYILMGNSSDDRTRVGAQIVVHPPVPAIQDRVLVRLAPAFGQRTLGSSSRAGEDYSVVAEESRTLPPVPLLTPGVLAGLPKYLEMFVVAGVDYNGDGELSLDEVNAAFGGAPRFGRIAYTPVGGVTKIKEAHLKVVPRAFWLAQVSVGSVTIVLNGFLTLLDIVNFSPLIGGDGVYSLAEIHLNAFINGIMPATPFSPDLAGSYEVPDNIRHQPGMSRFNHNTGVFKNNGFRAVPFYRYAPGPVTEAVLQSTGVRNAVKRNLNQPQFLEVLRQRAEAEESGDFTAAFTFSRTTGTGGQLHGNFYFGFGADPEGSALEPDLFAGVGGFALQDLRVAVQARRPAGEYLPGETPLSIVRVTIDTVLQDLYDWELEINPFAAVLSAGNEAFGPMGQPFQVEFPLAGDLDFSDFTLQ